MNTEVADKKKVADTIAHQHISPHKIRRKFTRLHTLIYHIKMPKEPYGYIRPRKFDHF
jgi:hypothetical protein